MHRLPEGALRYCPSSTRFPLMRSVSPSSQTSSISSQSRQSPVYTRRCGRGCAAERTKPHVQPAAKPFNLDERVTAQRTLVHIPDDGDAAPVWGFRLEHHTALHHREQQRQQHPQHRPGAQEEHRHSEPPEPPASLTVKEQHRGKQHIQKQRKHDPPRQAVHGAPDNIAHRHRQHQHRQRVPRIPRERIPAEQRDEQQPRNQPRRRRREAQLERLSRQLPQLPADRRQRANARSCLHRPFSDGLHAIPSFPESPSPSPSPAGPLWAAAARRARPASPSARPAPARSAQPAAGEAPSPR